MTRTATAALFVSVAALSADARAANLLTFDFNDSTAGSPGTVNLVADAGLKNVGQSLTFLSGTGTNGSAANAYGSRPGTDVNALAVGASPNHGLAISGFSNNYATVAFNVSTAGYKDIVFTFAAARSEDGYLKVGTNINSPASTSELPQSLTTAFTTYTVDYSSIAAIEDQPNVNISFYFQDITSPSNSLGYAVIDNIRIDATPIPEPTAATAGLLAAGVALLARRTRHRA